jgi:hypothetical protein
MARKEPAAEYLGRRRIARLSLEQQSNRGASLIISGMSARIGDSAMEKKFSVARIQHHIARSNRAESARFDSRIVAQHSYARDGFGAAPQVGLDPVVVDVRGLRENDGGSDVLRAARHEQCELAQRRSGAGTMRMGKENQRRKIRVEWKHALRRPHPQRDVCFTGSVLVSEESDGPEANSGKPERAEKDDLAIHICPIHVV